MDLTPDRAANAVEIAATVRTTGQTGVEMEALTAASVAALTVYDMCKAVDRGMRIEGAAGGAQGRRQVRRIHPGVRQRSWSRGRPGDVKSGRGRQPRFRGTGSMPSRYEFFRCSRSGRIP